MSDDIAEHLKTVRSLENEVGGLLLILAKARQAYTQSLAHKYPKVYCLSTGQVYTWSTAAGALAFGSTHAPQFHPSHVIEVSTEKLSWERLSTLDTK